MTQPADRPLEGRLILLGVTGSIAAYKAAELLRELIRAGADVQVMMSEAATRFIGPLTMEALSGRAVMLDPLELQSDHRIGHIVAADSADVILVAPATAHWLGAMANGLAGDILTATCLASSAPVVIGAGHGWRHVRTSGDRGQHRHASRLRLHRGRSGQRLARVGPGRRRSFGGTTLAGGRGGPGRRGSPRPPARSRPATCPRRGADSGPGRLAHRRQRRRHRRTHRPRALPGQSFQRQDGHGHRRSRAGAWSSCHAHQGHHQRRPAWGCQRRSGGDGRRDARCRAQQPPHRRRAHHGCRGGRLPSAHRS